MVEGADAIRDILRREPLAGAGDRRWVVDGEQAIVFYDVDADMARATGAAGAPDTWIPTYIAERFLVRDGLVQEIDPIFCADMAKNPHPERPVRYPEGDDAARRRHRHRPVVPRLAAESRRVRRCRSPSRRTASRTACTWAAPAPRSAPRSSTAA